MAATSYYHVFRQPTTLQQSPATHHCFRFSQISNPSHYIFPSLFICNSLSPLATVSKQNPDTQLDDQNLDEEDSDEYVFEEEKKIVVENNELKKETAAAGVKKVAATIEKAPSLSIKEKKELVSYAHGLGDKLKSQLVGKSGVTDSVAASFVENLESNELLKVKIHGTCPGELPEVIKHLEEATCSVAIGQVGRTVILYRPSLTKLRAEEKKLQNRRVFVRKTLKPVLPSRKVTHIAPEPGTKMSQRGRRGSSRV